MTINQTGVLLLLEPHRYQSLVNNKECSTECPLTGTPLAKNWTQHNHHGRTAKYAVTEILRTDGMTWMSSVRGMMTQAIMTSSDYAHERQTGKFDICLTDPLPGSWKYVTCILDVNPKNHHYHQEPQK